MPGSRNLCIIESRLLSGSCRVRCRVIVVVLRVGASIVRSGRGARSWLGCRCVRVPVMVPGLGVGVRLS